MPPRASLERAALPFDRRSTSLLRTGWGALGVVLGIIALVYWGVRRWLPTARIGDQGAIRVVGRTAVSPKHQVALLQVGRRFVLVGVSPDRLTALGEVRDPEESAELAAWAGLGRPSSAFNEELINEAASFEQPSTQEEVGEVIVPRAGDGREPLSALLNRLRRLQSKA